MYKQCFEDSNRENKKIEEEFVIEEFEISDN